MIELTILMPCLNEEKTVAYCVKKALSFIREKNIKGEVLVVDNGSIDNSYILAENAGARVVRIEEKGYGLALQFGIKQAKGTYIIMGDCDGSYDFSNLDDFIEQLRNGKQLVMGNRLNGIEKGAMPCLHKYIGVPILSWLGRIRYKTNINDFHCGLRGIQKAAFEKISFRSTGMEFASEMIGKAVKEGLNIAEIPIKLYPDKRNRRSHLRPFRDGLRHLKILLIN